MLDPHCHLNLEPLAQNPGKFIEEALAQGVTQIIIPAVDLATSQSAISLAQTSDHLYAMVGVHPEEAVNINFDNLYSDLKSLAQNSSVMAIGECGLDYFHTTETKTKQHKLFELQLQLAQDLDLPLSVHVRDAQNDAISTISKFKVKGVFHCFSGDADYLEKALQLGFYISFAGNLTFKNATHLQDLAKQVPLDKIFVETDAPYLNPDRGVWPNTPSQVALTYQFLANLKGITVEELSHQTHTNASELFRLK